MYEDTPPGPPPVAPAVPAKKKPRTLLIVLSAVTGVLALVVAGTVIIGLAGYGTSKTPPSSDAATKAAQPGAAATTAAVTPAVVPKPAVTDFQIAVKVLEKRCFGSAGCNLTFRIDVGWTTPPAPDKTYEVVYQINGGEEPKINRFTTTGGMVTYAREERIGTKDSKAVLTAVVIEVNEL